MPLYEYECPKDGTFEQMQKFSDPPLTACPKCGGPIEKLLSAPAIQFKGTGWYVTDYARKSEGKGGKSAKTEGGDGGGKSEGAKDSGASSGDKAATSSSTAKDTGSSKS